jgi:ATP synthase protein I
VDETPQDPKDASQDARAAAEDARARRKMLKITGSYSYIGIEFGVGLALGYFVGRWIDERYGTAPTWMYIMMGLGLAAAFRDLFRLVRRTKLDQMDDPS